MSTTAKELIDSNDLNLNKIISFFDTLKEKYHTINNKSSYETIEKTKFWFFKCKETVTKTSRNIVPLDISYKILYETDTTSYQIKIIKETWPWVYPGINVRSQSFYLNKNDLNFDAPNEKLKTILEEIKLFLKDNVNSNDIIIK